MAAFRHSRCGLSATWRIAVTADAPLPLPFSRAPPLRSLHTQPRNGIAPLVRGKRMEGERGRESENGRGEDCEGLEFLKLAAQLRQYRAISAAQILERVRVGGGVPIAEGRGGGEGEGSETERFKNVPGVTLREGVGTGPGGRECEGESEGEREGRGILGFRGDEAVGDEPTSSVGVPSSSDVAEKVGRTKNAAVLIALFRSPEGEIRVWLTKRASKMSSHSGEVALPGGKRDPEDIDDSATALREAMEEIGLPPSEVEVVTQLEPFVSKHLLTVTPVIGLVARGASFTPRPNLQEVEAVFSAPLAMFLEKDAHRCEDGEWLGLPYRVHHFHCTAAGGRPHDVWGLTAAILVRAAAVVFGRAPAFGEFHPAAPSYETMLADLAKRHLIHV